MRPLAWTDTSHRAGLLIGAMLFLADGVGSPWSRGLFGFAALPIAVLLVAMPAMSWQRLGDWRDARRAGLLVLSVVPVWMVVGAAISPQLDTSRLAEAAGNPAVSALGGASAVPFAEFAASVASAAVTLGHLVVLQIALWLAWKPGGLIAPGIAIALPVSLTLLYHPSVESLVGLLLLGWFFAVSWEVALMLPRHLERALDEHDAEFLAYLRATGRMRAAEVALMVPAGPGRLAELEALGLVRSCPDASCLEPGDALRAPAPREERRTGWLARAAWIAAGALYLIFPDLLPGPIDDFVVMLLCSYAGFRLPGRGAVSTEPSSGST